MESVYTGAPLEKLCPLARGMKIKNVARQIDLLIHGDAFTDCSVPISDSRKYRHERAEYDWCRDGSRIRCKSAQLCWEDRRRGWGVFYGSVKLKSEEGSHPPFDELWLAIYTPRGLYIYRHDLQFHVASVGLQSFYGARSISLRGPVGENDWSAALDVILGKLDGSSCTRLAFIKW